MHSCNKISYFFALFPLLHSLPLQVRLTHRAPFRPSANLLARRFAADEGGKVVAAFEERFQNLCAQLTKKEHENAELRSGRFLVPRGKVSQRELLAHRKEHLILTFRSCVPPTKSLFLLSCIALYLCALIVPLF